VCLYVPECRFDDGRRYEFVIQKDTKAERIQRASTRAGDYEVESRNCAQGTLLALCEEFGLDADADMLKAATFMPGVVANKETCGALLGAIMALGLAYGRGKLSDPEWTKPEVNDAWLNTRRRVHNFVLAFKGEFGSTMCGVIRPLIMGRDYDSLDPEDRRQFALDGGIQKCRRPPEVAARLAAALLLEDEK
jgi:C_GCAxxG_C_C family probable redox protein